MEQSEAYEDLIRILIKLGAEEVISRLISSYPILGAPIINPIFTMLVYKVCEVLIEQTEVGIYGLEVSAKVKRNIKEFQSLSELMNDSYIAGEMEDYEGYKKLYIDSVRDLIKLH